jgi:hypothetical protein
MAVTLTPAAQSVTSKPLSVAPSATEKPVVKPVSSVALSQQATSAPATELDNAVTSLLNTVTDGIYAVGHFFRRNQYVNRPMLRNQTLVNQSFWNGARTGGATHLASWWGLNHLGEAATQHAPHWMQTLQQHPNLFALLAGGVATLGAAGATWLGGLLMARGRDNVENTLARKGIMGNLVPLDVRQYEDQQTEKSKARSLQEAQKRVPLL